MADMQSHTPEGSIEALRGSNIVLVGMRGSGKTEVAKLLRSGIESRDGRKMQVIDTDDVIEKREGMPINEIVETKGEDYFRKLEDEVVQHAARQTNAIIATGGGAITRPENIYALRQNSFVVWLKANVPVLEERLKGKNLFPLNNEPTLSAKMEKTLTERKDFYERAKDEVLDTTSLTLDDVAKEIYEMIKKRKAKA